MGMNMGGRGKRRAMSEINVTPLVDVMLVLLVIFMVTAPVLKEGFQVEVPQAAETQSINVVDAWTVIIAKEGQVLHRLASDPEDKYEQLSLLVADLKAWKAEREAAPDSAKAEPPAAIIVADKDVRYERVVQVWNAVRSAGISQVAFQLDPGGPVASR
jgi:biopolymer transport protein TolR